MKQLRVLALCLVIVLCFGTCPALAADGNTSLSIQEILLHEDGQMDLIVYVPSTMEATEDHLNLTLDGQNVAIDAVNSLSNSSCSTTWLFLSDRYTLGATTTVKTLFSSLIDLMAKGDNAAILVNGNTVDQITLSSDQTNLKLLLDSDLLKRNTAEKTMNATAAMAIQYLGQYDQVNSRACLVMVSSGENQNETGMTAAELQDIIRASSVTVYTVTLKDTDPNTSLINKFESLARLSCGGMSVSMTSTVKESTITDTIGELRANEQCFRVISCNPAQAGISGKEVTLTLADSGYTMTATKALTANQVTAYEDILSGMLARAATPEVTQVPTPSPKPTAEPKPTVVVTFTPQPTAAPVSTAILTWMETHVLEMVLLAALVAVLVIILVVVLAKRSRAGVPDDPIVVPEPAPEPKPDPVTPGPKPHDPPVVMPQPQPAPVTPAPAAKQKPLVHVMFTHCHTGACYQADMERTLIAGRDPKRAQLLLNASDTSISGIHLRLTYQNGEMRARDISRNGTYINDHRIKDEVVLGNGQRIRLANAEYTITWTPLPM